VEEDLYDMSTDVAVRGPASALAIADGQDYWTDKQIAALRHLGAEEASDGDLAVFFHQATRTGLDPFARQIYLIGRNDKKRVQVNGEWVDQWSVKYTIQTGIDGFRLIARRAADRTHETLGYEDTLWCGEDGRWRETWFYSELPMAAKVTVLRNGNRFPAIAHFREYAQTTGQGERKRLTSMWERMPAGQIAKCAEALALRKAFPQDLSGIYIDEEMHQADQRADEAAAQDAARAQRVTPPRAGQRVVDGEAGPARSAASAPVGDSALRKAPEEWADAIAAIVDASNARQLWAQATAAGQLDFPVDADGGTVRSLITARVEELQRDAGKPTAPAAAPATDEDEAPEDVPEGVGEPIEGVIVGAGEPGPQLADTAAAPATPDAEDLRRPTQQRRAVITQLIEELGGKETMEAACEQTFGLVPDDVATRRLREWLGQVQQTNRAA
jgi:phage recombination protein Bet